MIFNKSFECLLGSAASRRASVEIIWLFSSQYVMALKDAPFFPPFLIKSILSVEFDLSESIVSAVQECTDLYRREQNCPDLCRTVHYLGCISTRLLYKPFSRHLAWFPSPNRLGLVAKTNLIAFFSERAFAQIALVWLFFFCCLEWFLVEIN